MYDSSKQLCLQHDQNVRQQNLANFLPSRPHPWSLFYHFVGAGADSHDFQVFLKRLLHHFNFLDEARDLDSIESQVQLVRNILSENSVKPALIFIDGVDQVSLKSVRSFLIFDSTHEAICNYPPISLVEE